jgi:hypothetical protein
MVRNTKNKNINLVCAICNKTFNPAYGMENKATTCSKECRAKYVAIKKTIPIEEAFDNRVVKTNGCWIWIGAINSKGYGVFRKERAHRISYRLNVSEIKPSDVVCHKCDNPRCVNPNHLFVGTQADNVHDMDSKNRRKTKTMHGIEHPKAKLTDDDIREIRSSKLSRKELEIKFNVSKTLIARILRKEVWKHVF